MTSKLDDIRRRLTSVEGLNWALSESWDDDGITTTIAYVDEESIVAGAMPEEAVKLIANAPDDLRALLAVVDASKRFKDVFGESRIDDWSDDFEAAMDAWMAAVDELTKG